MGLKVSEQQEGGFLDDVDAVLTFQTCEFDYNGSIPVPVPALNVTITYDKDGQETVKEEYYSAGNAQKVQPTEDGSGFVKPDGSEIDGLSQNCKAAQFLESLVDAGLDEDEYLADNNVKRMDGINVHLNTRPDATAGYGNKKADATILLVTKINSMPGEAKPKAKGKPAPPAAKGKPAPVAAKPAGAKGLDAALEAIISGLLSEADENTLQKSQLSALVFNKAKVDPKLKPELKNLTKRAVDDEFLGDESRPWTFDDDTLVGQ